MLPGCHAGSAALWFALAGRACCCLTLGRNQEPQCSSFGPRAHAGPLPTARVYLKVTFFQRSERCSVNSPPLQGKTSLAKGEKSISPVLAGTETCEELTRPAKMTFVSVSVIFWCGLQSLPSAQAPSAAWDWLVPSTSGPCSWEPGAESCCPRGVEGDALNSSGGEHRVKGRKQKESKQRRNSHCKRWIR